MATKGHLSMLVLWLLCIQVSLGVDEMRLSDGTGPCSGRVEIKHEEQWGTVCDGDWTMKDAEVVCKQLQCGSAVQAFNDANFGQGSGPTWLYRVVCRGDETTLWNCSHAGWGVFSCPHTLDTGVACSGFSGLRLTGRDTACSGHLKVKQETWLTVCFSHIDFKAASVICNELECGEAVGISRGTHFGDKHEQIWQEKFHCLGNETHLAHCPRMLLHNKTCSHDATVVCSGYGGYRLANGSTRCSGRVELLHGGTWGTLCDYLWDLPAANDLCQQLDCGVALQIPDGQLFGKGNGSVWNGTFSCKNNSSYQRDCFVSVLGHDECPAGKDARVVCSGCPGGRLVNGTTCSGRVEIRHGDTWGRLCQSHWNLKAANVLCHQLNCGYAKSIQTGDDFAAGDGPVWRDAFHCNGTESCLWDCAQVTLGNPSCSAREPATVVCSGLAESLRLSGGESRCDGRVEILLHGIWSRVLDDDWDIKDAHVVCRQLECGIAKKAYYLPRSERGTGVVGLRSVQCAGNETQLMLCQTSHSPTVPSGVAEDVGVVCSGSRQIRLVNATNRCAGRVELYHDGVWGTICDDYWDLSDASVVCKQLGCGHAIKALGFAHYGEGSGQIWLDDVKCTGAESDIWACPASALGQHDCQHEEDAGVLCSGFSGLRLTGRDTACSGHLKVKQETWLTVCFSHIDFKAASVICNELECGEAVGISRGTHFGDKHEQIWQEKFHCLGNETHLAHCPRMLLHNKTCSHDATVVCSGYGGYRLANGSTRCSGRVELLHGGTWGTLCDYLWDLPAANDLCQQLDCGVALQIPDGQSFGKGNGSVWNGTFSCKNNGSYQGDCFVSVLGHDECPAGKDARVVCSGCPGGRLVNGTTCSGRVEIRHGDTWGRLCQSHWNLKAANVLCHQLNCGYAKSIQTGDDFAAGDGPVWRDAFHCDGTESCLWDCAQVTLGNPSCSAREPATVVCSGLAESLRLSGGESRCDGRVEILLHGIWSRVLDDDWDIKDAHVVCRQLECGIAKKAYYLPRSERGTGVVGLRSVQCAGNETQLMLCQTSHSPTVPSGVAEDVGVVCSGSRQIRLVNATNRCAGRVELYHDGVWGTICDDYWDLSDASVVCKQLGCGHAIKAFGSAHYGEGSGQIWLDDVKCTGAESDIWACPARALGQHNCQHKEDAGVLCSEFLALRLVNGNGCTGRLEVFYNGTWGSICSNQMSQLTAVTVCKHLNCGDDGEIARDFEYGRGSGPTWLDHIECTEQQSSLWQCQSDPWNAQSCDNRAEETHISCTGRKEATSPATFAECPNSTSCSDREKLRVIGGEYGCSGRVEIWQQGSWGTVCDDSWDLADANVVCRQLGCGSALSALSEAAFGEGTGPIWLEKVHCKGTELSLWDCPAKPLFGKNCDHKEDAAVECSGVTETTASPTRADPPRRPATGSTRLSTPIILCIVLGALLCLVLAILAGQIQRARAQQKGYRLSYDPFSEAVYEEIDYNLMKEKQGMTGFSDSYSETSKTKAQFYSGDSDEENGPGATQEVSPLPENAPEDSYDDATEVPGPKDAPFSEQNDQEIIGIPEESDRKKDSQTGWSPNVPGNGTSAADRHSSPALEDTGYDDIEEL